MICEENYLPSAPHSAGREGSVFALIYGEQFVFRWPQGREEKVIKVLKHLKKYLPSLETHWQKAVVLAFVWGKSKQIDEFK